MITLCEPKAYLIAKTHLDFTPGQGLGTFLNDEGIDNWEPEIHTMEGSSQLSEVAGRVCYMSFSNPRPGGNKAYLAHIKEVGHGSVLEHGSFSILLTGVSRGLTHELVRHRAGMAYSQLSTRYVDSKYFRYVMPESAKGNKAVEDTFIEAFSQAHEYYNAIYNEIYEKLHSSNVPGTATEIRKIARGVARSVLPTNVETKIVVTGNCRAWRHILEMRMSLAAEIEIRKAMNLVYDILVKEEPNIFGDYIVSNCGDGTRYISEGNRRV